MERFLFLLFTFMYVIIYIYSGQHPNTKQKQTNERDKPIKQLFEGKESVLDVHMPKHRQRY